MREFDEKYEYITQQQIKKLIDEYITDNLFGTDEFGNRKVDSVYTGINYRVIRAYLNDDNYEIFSYIFVGDNHQVIKLVIKYDINSIGVKDYVYWCSEANNIECTDISGVDFQTSIEIKHDIEKLLTQKLEYKIVRAVYHD